MPFRTNSHFGYNLAKQAIKPKQYHIPTTRSSFVAAKKPFTFNEIFSSHRYVDLCDRCFEKIVCIFPNYRRLKSCDKKEKDHEPLSTMSTNNFNIDGFANNNNNIQNHVCFFHKIKNNLTYDPSVYISNDNFSKKHWNYSEVFTLSTTTISQKSTKNGTNYSRKLMTRLERNQRINEFRELWEDHIQYYSSKYDIDVYTEPKYQSEFNLNLSL